MTYRAQAGLGADVSVDASAAASFDAQLQSGKDPEDAAKAAVESEADKYLSTSLAVAGAAACTATGAGAVVAGLCGTVAAALAPVIKDIGKAVGEFFTGLFGGEKPKPIRFTDAELRAAWDPKLYELTMLQWQSSDMDCKMMAALISAVSSVSGFGADIGAQQELGWPEVLSAMRAAGLRLDDYLRWRLRGDDEIQKSCLNPDTGLLRNMRWQWHQDYQPPALDSRVPGLSLDQQLAAVRASIAEKKLWIDDLEYFASKAVVIMAARKIAASVPTTEQIIYLASAMNCDQLAPGGCWPDATALVGALCSRPGVPAGVSAATWRAFCTKVGSCGEKPLCSAQVAERQARNRLLLGGAVVAGGALWLLARRT